jgi:hypothetical protein
MSQTLGPTPIEGGLPLSPMYPPQGLDPQGMGAPKQGAVLLVGPNYQARVPPAPGLKSVKGMLTQEERAMMGEVVMGVGPEEGAQSLKMKKEEIVARCVEGLTASLDLGSRHVVMDLAIRELDAEVLGPGDDRTLGVHLLGSKTRALWVEKDEASFAQGVKKHDREFELIQRDYLPHKTMSQLISYYYNVWKIRYTATSESHHAAKRAKKEKVAKLASPTAPGSQQKELSSSQKS